MAKTTPATGGTGSSKRDEMPRISPFLARGFRWYLPRYLRRHFSAVRLALGTAPKLRESQAVICFANHPGWWDPLIAMLLNQRLFQGQTFYAPIDQRALEAYPVFAKLGYYGIDLASLDGARHFLRLTRRLLAQHTTALWLTPGGQFSDVRQRTAFRPGLSHLAATVPDISLVPMAIEYTFWQERTPEALIEFGPLMETVGPRRTKDQWQSELEDQLARDPSVACGQINRPRVRPVRDLD